MNEEHSIKLARIEEKIDTIQKQNLHQEGSLLLLRREVEDRLRLGALKMGTIDVHEVRIKHIEEAISNMDERFSMELKTIRHSIWYVVGLQLIQAVAIVWRYLGGVQ